MKLKRSELFFSGIQLPVDAIMLYLGAITAFWIRNIPEVLAYKQILYTFSFSDYTRIVLLVMPLFLGIFALEGLYSTHVTRKPWQETMQVFKAISIGLVIIIVAIFLKREWFSSRFIILAAWGLSFIYILAMRHLLHGFQRYLVAKRGIGVHRVLLINGSKKTNFFKRLFQEKRMLGYRVIDTVSDANLHIIKDIKKKKGIDEIILCDPTLPDDQQEKLIDYCSIHNIGYSYVPTSLQTAQFSVRFLGGEPLFEITHTPLDGWNKILKRIFDIIASSILIILLSPIILIAAIAIRLESKGPIIFRNERIGADGKKFKLFKFRYMKWEYSTSQENPSWRKALEYEKQLIIERSLRKGPLYKIKDDPRKTKVGAFIERYSIDELPQLFNVFMGSMSLVGPRPHQEREVNKYREYHRRLLTIKPGVTGMAQISGRSDLDFEDEYKLDVFYIEEWSLWLDISICLKTVPALLRRRKNV